MALDIDWLGCCCPMTRSSRSKTRRNNGPGKSVANPHYAHYGPGKSVANPHYAHYALSKLLAIQDHAQNVEE